MNDFQRACGLAEYENAKAELEKIYDHIPEGNFIRPKS